MTSLDVGPVARRRGPVPPEALFVLGGIAQYSGASLAIGLFDHLRPATVALLRVLGGALSLIAFSWLRRDHRRAARRPWTGWTRASVATAAAFGTATALMNLFIYEAFARIDLGKAVAIEFSGPIAVAAVLTRSRRNAAAVALALVGVWTLSTVEFDPAGTAWVLAASTMWAGYIVMGWRVARLDRGLDGLVLGLVVGDLVLLPLAAPGLPAAFTAPRLLATALLVGVLSTGVAYGIDQHVLRLTSARRFAVIQALLPVTAVVIGAVTLAQRPVPKELAGIALVLGALMLQTRDG
ncbi:MAG: EamA family transporter [Ilumatobacteraceae bacterium]